MTRDFPQLGTVSCDFGIMINQAPSKPRKAKTQAFRPAKPKDDQLWSPLEFVLFSLAIVAVFAFTMGQEKYIYVAYLFEPVFALGILGLALQWAYKIRQKKRLKQHNL